MIVWTLVAWVGRVLLLTPGDYWLDRARIVGSLVVGLVAGLLLILPSPARWARSGIYVFSVWTIVIWARSLFVNWTSPGTLQFKLVHTALALGFGLLVFWGLALNRRASQE
jgi:hypothetical protein